MTDTPAFPMAVPENWDSIQDGMTLRDYFAGQALVALLSRSDFLRSKIIAENAYAYADAMLEERGEEI
jgi:hypothetical protein